VVTLAGQAARVIVQLAGIVILARLLSIADFGLLAMVVAITGAAEVFRDFGLSTAAVQAKTLSRDERDNLFWANTVIGIGLAVVVFACAPLVAMLYGEPALVPITQALAGVFAVNGLSTQYRASLNRSFRFTALAIADVSSAAAGLGLAVVAAVLGMGVWALVIQQVAIAVVGLIVLAALARWRPGLPKRGVSIRPFVGFGVHLVVSQFVQYAARNTDSVVIGAWLGPTALGLYDRAYRLFMVPLTQINVPASKVAVPVLARLQDDKERYDRYILHGQSLLLQVMVPVFALLCAQGHAVILIALGDKWLGAVLIFQILTVTGLARAAGIATYWVALSKGLTKVSMYLAFISAPITIGAVLIGANWGVVGVAAGTSIAALVLWPIGLWFYGRMSDAPVWAMFVSALKPIVAYGLCGLASWLSVAFVSWPNAFAELGVGVAVFVVTAGLAWLVWPAHRRDVNRVLASRRQLSGRPR
jgi:PST family polysaccharide transporter